MVRLLAAFVVHFVLPQEPPQVGLHGQEAASEPAISEDTREEARELFRQGNSFFERDQYTEALEFYRQALKRWDHPAAHFNIAVCLINLDQPVAAYGHLEQALRAGPEGLGAHFHTQAITYEKLLLGRLARLEVSCTQPGAMVTLDGKHLLDCPDAATRYLLPGEHQLVGDKPGFAPVARVLDLRAGETTSETVELLPPSAVRRYERRWKPWVPWIPMAIGVATGLAGVGVRVAATNHAKQFDREVGRLCPQGCDEQTVPFTVRQLRPRAVAESNAAIGLFVAGGAAVVTGVVLLILNRQREVKPTAPSMALAADRNGVGFTVLRAF